MTRQARKGYVNLGGRTAGRFITLAVIQFVFEGDHVGIEIARSMCDRAGNHPPIDAMVTDILCAAGRLLVEGTR